MRHVSTHLHREQVAAERTAALDQLAELPDAADVEAVTLLQVDLSAQRRQVVRASQWLDPDDRTLLSLWWMEVAGQLTRSELASALGVSVAHTGVRVQRMRQQLDLSRSVVAALTARPGCPRLGRLLVDWDGSPGPLWRKRIARHARSCDRCTRVAGDMVAAERLLVGFALLPLPLALTATVVAKLASTGGAVGGTSTVALTGASGGAGVKLGLLGQLAQAVGAHPVAATVAAGALVVGTTATAVTWPATAPPPPPSPPRRRRRVHDHTPAGGRPPTAVPPAPLPRRPMGHRRHRGRWCSGRCRSSRSTSGPVRHHRGQSRCPKPLTDGAPATGQLAALEVVVGLADPDCFSFRSPDGRYLRHMSWRVQPQPGRGDRAVPG